MDDQPLASEQRGHAQARITALEQMTASPGWRIYYSELSEVRDRLQQDVSRCLSKGDTAGAIIKNELARCIADCLDIPKLAAADAKLTLTMDEDSVKAALDKERVRR